MTSPALTTCSGRTGIAGAGCDGGATLPAARYLLLDREVSHHDSNS